MLKNLLSLSSLLILTACQSVPVKTAEREKAYLPGIATIDNDADQDGVLDSVDKCLGTPLNEVVDKEGCPIAVRYTECYEPPTLRVFFDKDSSFPKEQYLTEIAKMAEKLTEYPKSTISIEGHALKSEKNPEKISRDRAIILAQILKEKYSISEKRITLNSYGTERPIAPNTTEEGRAMNQRIYAVILHNSQ